MENMEKKMVRTYVAEMYGRRNGRNVRIMADGAVHVTVDGDGTQMVNGRDMTEGVLFAGWDTEIMRLLKV